MAEVVTEKMEIEKRECNVTVYSFPELADKDDRDRDVRELRKLLNEMDDNVKDVEISEVTRIGRKIEGRSRLLRFKVNKPGIKENIIKNSFKINKDKANKVYFNAYLTPLQRENQKKLRDELRVKREQNGNRNFVIRGDKILEIKTFQGVGRND